VNGGSGGRIDILLPLGSARWRPMAALKDWEMVAHAGDFEDAMDARCSVDQAQPVFAETSAIHPDEQTDSTRIEGRQSTEIHVNHGRVALACRLEFALEDRDSRETKLTKRRQANQIAATLDFDRERFWRCHIGRFTRCRSGRRFARPRLLARRRVVGGGAPGT